MKNKKGFTIVELVIVIAVIAILAAVLIPTFSNVIAKANKSADLQAAKNAHTDYLIDVPADNIGAATEAKYVYVGNQYNVRIENSKAVDPTDDDKSGKVPQGYISFITSIDDTVKEKTTGKYFVQTGTNSKLYVYVDVTTVGENTTWTYAKNQ